MQVTVRKAGNSTALRIPPEVVEQLNLSAGEKMTMTVNDNALIFEKQKRPRQGWFDNIDPMTACAESKAMEADFGGCQADAWEHADEW